MKIKKFDAKEEFTSEVNGHNVSIEFYRKLTPLVRDVVDKYEKEIDYVYFNGIGGSITLRFKKGTPPSFFLECDGMGLEACPACSSYGNSNSNTIDLRLKRNV